MIRNVQTGWISTDLKTPKALKQRFQRTTTEPFVERQALNFAPNRVSVCANWTFKCPIPYLFTT